VFDYYSDKLSAERLKRCYEIASPRVKKYLEAELGHVARRIKPGDSVLELGCGYGRVLLRLVDRAGLAVGIDTSPASLHSGREMLSGIPNCHLLCMNAVRLAFADRVFDRVICIQNGISAFHVDQRDLIRESVRVTKPGGTVFFSSYAETFWDHRLEWFIRQSEAGLVGEIDFEKTGDGVIVCKDGFTATTVGPDEFRLLTWDLDADTRILEVDESSLFCEISPRHGQGNR
jgi:2-polyprenyl-6-hydroxyphenyl methylase/3-demethylubiquinone-9 3-methyltransferase